MGFLIVFQKNEQILINNIPYFTEKQISDFIKELTSFHTQATCFMTMAQQIVDTVKTKGYEIKYDEYNINLLKFVEW